MTTKHKGFLISSSDCVVRGMHDTLEEAENMVDVYQRSSFFRHTMKYSILECEYELLRDGRAIIADRVFCNKDIFETREDAVYLHYVCKKVVKIPQ